MFWLLKKIVFFGILAFGVYYLYSSYASPFLVKNSPDSKMMADNVLGTATKFANKQASTSASFLDKVLFKQATKPIIEQYNKLPKEKQEELKKHICK